MSGDAPAQAGRFGRILLVGDSERIGRARSAIERGVGSDAVATASSVDDATGRLAGADCVVVDADDADGTEVLERLATRSRAPVLALTEGDGAEQIRAGAREVVDPDAPADVFLARIGNLARRPAAPDDEGEPSLEWFRALVGATSAAVLVVDADRRVSWASPAVERSIERTPAELEGEELGRLFHPADGESILDAVDEVARAGVGAERRTACRVRVGGARWASVELVVVNRLSDPAIAGFVCTIERADPEPTPTVLDAIDDPVFAVDDDWTIATSNEAAESLLGAPPDGPGGVVLWELLPESTVTEWYERLEEARAREEPVEFDVDHPEGPGRLEVRAYPAGSTLAIVATRRPDSAGARYRERLEDLASLLDAVDAPAFVVDDGRVAAANAATFEYVGASAVVGRKLGTLVDEELADGIAERAESPVRRLDPLVWTADVDGDRRVVELSVVPLGEGRAACVGDDATARDRLRRATTELATLSTASLDAGSIGEVRRLLLSGLRDALDVPHAVWYRRDDDRLSPVAHASARSDLEPPSIAWKPLDAESLDVGRAIVADRTERIPLGDDAAIAGPLVVPVDEDALAIAGGESATFEDSATDVGDLVAGIARLSLARVGAARDRRELERELSRRRERFDSARALLDRRRDVDRRLLEADSRAELEAGVCEALCELEDVALATIVERAGADDLAIRASAGDAASYLTALLSAGEPDPAEPTVRALARRSSQFVDAAEPTVGDDGWTALAARHGIRAAVAVPIEADGLPYGVLAVYASRPDAFDEATTEFCVDAARATAVAVDAAEARRALLTDDVVVLELGLDSDEAPEVLSTLVARTGADVELETVAPGPERSTLYLAVRGTDAERAVDALADVDRVVAVERLSDAEDPVRLEVVVEGRTLAEVLVAHAGVLRTVDVGGEETRVVVELPSGRDVRAFVTALRETAPSAELLARRSERRSGPAGRMGGADVRTALTDRQLEVLRTAYAAGYFEWPRERTGEEVAERLGISQPTFTRHFRAAERAVFAALFGER